jgi:K+-sensing histidine kinase KdpD
MLDLPDPAPGTPPVPFLSRAKRLYRCEPPQAWADWLSDEPALDASRLLVRPEDGRGAARWIEASLFHPPESGESNRLVRLKDISSHVTNQRVMWTFHSMINHKLRTPFAWLISGAHMLCDQDLDMSREEITEVARSMSEEAKRLHGEIEDILDYLEAPSLVRRGGACLLSEIPALAQEIAKEVGLEDLGVLLEPALEQTRIAVSSKALDLILLELLENSKKFHPTNKPSVSVEVKPMGPKAAIMSVTDDGLSLPEDLLDQVWTPYYQGEKDHTGQISGMGLGLSMVSSMVWEAGGQCGIYNRKDGPGVVVKLVFPLA